MAQKLIIHVTGAPASGKTTMVNKLKSKNYSAFHIIDLDKFYESFKKSAGTNYQKYIDEFIDSKRKSIIFIGLNMDMGRSNTLFDMHSTHNYYIDVPMDILLKRHFLREINGWTGWMHDRDHNILFDQLETDPNVKNHITLSLGRVLDLGAQKQMLISFKAKYPNYQVGTYSSIINKLSKLITKRKRP